jgi:peptidyl-prolyl cis-trans isomerase D
MAPEYRTFHVAMLRYADFREGLDAPEEDLRRLYEINRARLYDQPERRTLYQLAFESETQAQAAASALRQGRPFEAIALERGRTLEAVTYTEIVRGDILDPKVAEAAFAADLSAGEIAGPVDGMFGWTVVQLVDITPPESRSYEEVRDELEAQFLEQDTRRRVLAAIDAIEELRDTGAAVAVAAEGAGVQPLVVGPVDRTGKNPAGEAVAAASERILAEAFRLPEGEESEAVELPDRDGYFYVHVDEVTPTRARDYAEVEEEVERRWRREERQRRISNTVRSIREAIESGESFSAAAAPLNRAPLTMTVRRNVPDATLSRALIEQVFAADKGAVVSGPTAVGDAQVIVEVRDIDFARHLVGPGEQIGFSQYVGYQIDQELLEAYILALREDYGVRIDEQAVARIFAGQ